MNRLKEDEFVESDAELAGSLSDDEPDEAEEKKLRASRIEEFAYEANRRESAMRATLAGLTAGLLEIGVWSENMVKNTIKSAATDEAQTPQVFRAIGIHGNICRQIDRFANLDARLAEAERQAENLKAQRRRAALQPPSRASLGRNRS